MQIQIKNRFLQFKADFRNDTGLQYGKETMDTYIQYVNARINDISSQITIGLSEQMLLKLNRLPDDIRLQIADMIKTHDTIKKIIEK